MKKRLAIIISSVCVVAITAILVNFGILKDIIPANLFSSNKDSSKEQSSAIDTEIQTGATTTIGTFVIVEDSSTSEITGGERRTEATTTFEYTKPELAMINADLTGLYVDNRYYLDPEVQLSFPESARIDGVPMIYQNALGLPTGCEIVAAVMAIQFSVGEKITTDDVMPHLTVGKAPYWTSSGTYGSDPEYAFIGDPTGKNGFGCYSPVIEEMINKYFNENGQSHYAKNITNCNFDEVLYYVSQGKPVIAWATGRLKTPVVNIVYKVLEADYSVTWLAGEHCVVITGFDENYIYINDPLYGTISYSIDQFQLRWEQMGRQAIIIEE